MLHHSYLVHFDNLIFFILKGTYCQQRELEAITEWADSDGGILICFNFSSYFIFVFIFFLTFYFFLAFATKRRNVMYYSYII